MNNFDYLRARLHAQAGVDLCYDAPCKNLSYADIHTAQCRDDFARLMDSRLCMGWLRYNNARTSHVGTFMQRMQKKLRAYNATGNTELLVDVANYARLEFRRPSHPNAHFHAIDRHD